MSLDPQFNCAQGTKTHNCSRHGALVFAGIVLGAAFSLAILVIWPDVYLEIADRFRWRLGLPAVGQVRLEATLAQVQLRGDSVAGGSRATLLFGDSHLHGLPAAALDGAVTNYAIAGEPASRLARRMGRYASVQQSRQVVLLSGGNDLAAGVSPAATAESVALAMRQIPPGTTVLLIEVPPVHADSIRHAAVLKLNQELSRHCAARSNCRFVKLSALADSQNRLRSEYSSADGIHLSAAGYQVLADALKEVIRHASQ